jgi:hypothetical protein
LVKKNNSLLRKIINFRFISVKFQILETKEDEENEEEKRINKINKQQGL